MDSKAITDLIRSRMPIIPLSGMLVLLAALGLVVLTSAEAPPISVEKSADRAEVLYGDHVKYTVVFSNSSASDVDLEVVSDTLPVGFTFISMGVGSSILHDPEGVTSTIVWNQGPYPVSASDTFTLAYNVRATAAVRTQPYENRVQARLSTGEIVEDAEQVQVVGPHLDGSKQASAAQVRKGRPVDYTVHLHNSGTADAILSAIVDTLPAGFAFEKMVSGPLPAPSVQANQLTWAGPIAIAEGATLQFSYRVIVGGIVGHTYSNSVQAAYDGQLSSSFRASVTVLPARVYLPLVLTVEEEPPPPPTHRLAFDSKVDGGNFDIWAVDADGTDRLNVSNLAEGDMDPDWSADGTRIVWVHYVGDKGDIYAANADGTVRVTLSDHEKDEKCPRWSPAGDKIVFQRRVDFEGEVPFQLFWMDPDNPTTKTQLTFGDRQSHDPVWSPDGTMIAYVWGYNEYAEICVLDVATKDSTCLTDNGVEEKAPSWSPDNTRLVFVRFGSDDSELHIVNVSTGVVTPLTNNSVDDYSPDWSPDGTKIAFSTYIDGSYEIATVNTSGQNLTNLTRTAAGIGDYVPKWSPDGAMILFISNRDGRKELYVMNADGSDPFRLTNTATDESMYVWQP